MKILKTAVVALLLVGFSISFTQIAAGQTGIVVTGADSVLDTCPVIPPTYTIRRQQSRPGFRRI